MGLVQRLYKEKSVKCLKKLKILNRFIKDFEKNNTVYYFVTYVGGWAWKNEILMSKIKELEKYGLMIYAVIMTNSQEGIIYDFLFVCLDEELWEIIYPTENIGNIFYLASYSWIKDDDVASHFGIITVHSEFGGLRRIA